MFTNRNAMPGQAHGGAYVSKGLQDKAALDYPRVWNDELPGVDDVLAEVEDIQVDDPRGVRWRIRGASEAVFDVLGLLEELEGGARKGDFDYGIKEVRRALGTVHGDRAVDGCLFVFMVP